MARIAGVNIPTNKRVVIALQYIHGIGSKKAQEICEAVSIPAERRVNELSDSDVLRIREVIDGWLDQQLSFDGIFASSDVTAISIIGALNERGLRVPQDVRVVGYDDIALAEHVHPPLTTVRQPTLEAGRALVELLFEAMAGLPRRTVTLPTRLIERESAR